MGNKQNPPVKKGFLGWYFNFNLLYRILIGLILGALLGIIFGDKILWVAPFGSLFVRLLRMIMMPIIISTLVVGSASISPATLGKVGVRVILFYLLTSAFAVFIGLMMGTIFQPSAEMATLSAEAAGRAAASQPLSAVLLNIVPMSVAQAVVNETILQVIFFAIIFGIGLSYLRISKDERIRKAGDSLFFVFDGTAEIMMRMVNGIMQYAPIGVLALVADVFARQGSQVAGSLAIVTLACFTGYILHVVLVYGGLLKFNKLSIRRFFKDAKDPFVTAFVTRSSGGTLPVTIKASANLGIPKDISAFSPARCNNQHGWNGNLSGCVCHLHCLDGNRTEFYCRADGYHNLNSNSGFNRDCRSSGSRSYHASDGFGSCWTSCCCRNGRSRSLCNDPRY